jgi:hypothetical protein
MQALAGLAATDFAAAGSPEGKAWMAALPSLLRDLATQWDLTTDGGLLGRGYNAVVLPVRQSGRPLALKLTWPPGRARKEADALAAWRARGTVDLTACDAARGALLLERLDGSRSLAAIPVAEAAAAAGTLIRTLAIAPSGSFPSLRERPARRQTNGGHLSRDAGTDRLHRCQRGYSSGWRAMAGGSRPASSQLTTIAISGMPTRIHSRPATGTLSSSESWSSRLVLKKPIAAR